MSHPDQPSHQPWPAPPAPRPRASRAKTAGIGCGGLVGAVLLLALIGNIIGPPKKTVTTSAAVPAKTTAAAPTATGATATAKAQQPVTAPPSKAAQAPAPTSRPSTAAPSPTDVAQASCTPTRDIIVRTITPDLPASAEVLGNYDIQNCEPTFQSLQASSPTDPGFCTQAAWASDNPGYDADATPAAPLKNIQVEYGPAC
ncbi:hypothetical protein GCM10010442_38220 [Kitasatospora kifunensis]